MRQVPGWRRFRSGESNRSAEVRDEIEFHVAGRIEELVEAGHERDHAEQLVLQRFGSPDEIHARSLKVAETGARQPGSRVVEPLLRDIRLALRNIRRRPGFSGAVIVTLGLALGSTTAIFSVINGVLLKPLPHPEPDRLVNLYEVDERPGFYTDHNNVTAATFLDWREMNRSFEYLAGYQTFRATFRDDEGAVRVPAGTGTDQFFEVMGARAIMGRLFVESEFRPGAPDVVVVSHEFWLNELGGDPEIIGKTIRLAGNPEVVGVLEPGFEFLGEEYAGWIPYVFTDNWSTNRQAHVLKGVARLLPGVSAADAQRDMERITATLTAEYPRFMAGFGVNVMGMADDIVGPSRSALYLLMGASLLLLVIAAVNVANLMLVRLRNDEQGYSIRAALGAGRGRLVAQAMTDTLVLALTGGLLGLVVARVGLDFLLELAAGSLPRTNEVGLDVGVMGYALLATLLVGVGFGIIPAVRGSRAELAGSIRESSRGLAGAGGKRIRDLFVVIQVAFSLMLMISTALLSATFLNLLSADSGFDETGVMTANLALRGSQYPAVSDQTAVLDRIEEEVGAVAGVTDVGFTRFVPLKDAEWTWSVTVEGAPPPPDGTKLDYGLHPVHGDYFRAMGMRLVQGRFLNEFDNADGLLVAVVNEQFVDRFFPNENALGKRFRFANAAGWIEIVGVVQGTRHYDLSREPEPAYYLPEAQNPYDWFFRETYMIVRVAGDPAAIVRAVRNAVSGVDSEIPMTEVVTLQDYVSRSVARTELAMTLLGVFAAVALVLATVGIYGVMSNSVEQRTREIGIRIALGAEPARIVRSFVLGGLATALVGIVLGVVGSGAVARVQASLLYGADPVEPGIYAIVALSFAVVAATASYLPARRAGRLDATQVLREE